MSNSSFYSNTGITSADVSSITSSKEAAATSETNAATSATNAATSATQAATSATNASTSETNAATSATNAATSASSVGTSETNASASAATATTQASNAATSATAAAGSASAANTSKTNAASSETSAATSATNAATSATSAATSATSAGTSATNAGTSETNAAASSSSASGYVTSATTQANNAATSATAAATSETNAATSATAASTSASGASTSASNANTSATNAASSASQAATSAAAAALAADNFDDTYLGSNSSDPTADNDGDALNAGDLHFNTTSNTLKVYNGSAWQDAAVDSSGFVQTTGDTLTGALTFASGQTFDGRDVSADGAKLDTVETNADVTDTTNVTAAGALMDSELTSIASVKALNQGVATTDDPTFTNTQLAALAATISDTAVDIFVYDTRKDSDGGAWRKRTQGTSWYNEAASATRGSRKEFPAVAVIVAESNQVTIYDGDDPDLPMWMVFNSNSGAIYHTHAVSCVSMLNGILTIGISSTYGVSISNFVTENIQNIRNTFGVYTYNGSIVYRNSSSGQTLNSANPLVNGNTNDVAMIVLPNAPIDAATGLPAVTTAVATDGGVSVIKDDGTVVDITGANSYNKSTSVNFTPDKKLVYSLDYSGNSLPYSRYIRVDNIPSADFSATSAAGQVGNSLEFYSVNPVEGQLNWLGTDNSNENLLIANNVGTENGLTFLERNQSAPANGMVAYTASDYNTGYQVGDIKLATLSDTSTTNVTGAELITNGTFSSDSNWTKQSGWVISGGVATYSGSLNNYIESDAFTTVVGQKYVCTVEVTAITAGCVNLYFHDGSTFSPNSGSPILSSTGVLSVTIVATGTSTKIRVYAAFTSGARFAGSIDNVSVRLAEQDRSVNGNGLQVFGTVGKSAVNGGADLIYYTFADGSNTNFLFQPYNSDLNFGTGDFSYTFWHSCASSGSDRIWLAHGRYTTAGSGLGILQYNSGGTGDEIIIYIGASSAGNINITGVEGLGFQHWVITRRSGIVYAYRNGKLEGSVANTTDIDLSSATIKGLYLGKGNNTSTEGNAFTYGANRLALFRASATAPSPEQIAKIYEDEKVLFQENAQATLYGSSDAVTALAYDDTTELLHVGTSAGRSDFQGLRRVNNTTNAVGAAISASNGMIVEE